MPRQPSPDRVARPKPGQLTHILVLSPPREPGGKGDDGRWMLHHYVWPTGTRTPIYGLLANDYAGAKKAAKEHLKRSPRWKRQGQSLVAERKEA
jgi:hypothetical protein